MTTQISAFEAADATTLADRQAIAEHFQGRIDELTTESAQHAATLSAVMDDSRQAVTSAQRARSEESNRRDTKECTLELQLAQTEELLNASKANREELLIESQRTREHATTEFETLKGHYHATAKLHSEQVNMMKVDQDKAVQNYNEFKERNATVVLNLKQECCTFQSKADAAQLTEDRWRRCEVRALA